MNFLRNYKIKISYILTIALFFSTGVNPAYINEGEINLAFILNTIRFFLPILILIIYLIYRIKKKNIFIKNILKKIKVNIILLAIIYSILLFFSINQNPIHPYNLYFVNYFCLFFLTLILHENNNIKEIYNNIFLFIILGFSVGLSLIFVEILTMSFNPAELEKFTVFSFDARFLDNALPRSTGFSKYVLLTIFIIIIFYKPNNNFYKIILIIVLSSIIFMIKSRTTILFFTGSILIYSLFYIDGLIEKLKLPIISLIIPLILVSNIPGNQNVKIKAAEDTVANLIAKKKEAFDLAEKSNNYIKVLTLKEVNENRSIDLFSEQKFKKLALKKEQEFKELALKKEQEFKELALKKEQEFTEQNLRTIYEKRNFKRKLEVQLLESKQKLKTLEEEIEINKENKYFGTKTQKTSIVFKSPKDEDLDLLENLSTGRVYGWKLFFQIKNLSLLSLDTYIGQGILADKLFYGFSISNGFLYVLMTGGLLSLLILIFFNINLISKIVKNLIKKNSHPEYLYAVILNSYLLFRSLFENGYLVYLSGLFLMLLSLMIINLKSIKD